MIEVEAMKKGFVLLKIYKVVCLRNQAYGWKSTG